MAVIPTPTPFSNTRDPGSTGSRIRRELYSCEEAAVTLASSKTGKSTAKGDEPTMMAQST